MDKLLEKSQHEHEMEQLKREKEEALAEEIKITKAGIYYTFSSPDKMLPNPLTKKKLLIFSMKTHIVGDIRITAT